MSAVVMVAGSATVTQRGDGEWVARCDCGDLWVADTMRNAYGPLVAHMNATHRSGVPVIHPERS